MNLENRLRELGDQILKLTEHNQLKTEIAMVSLKSIHQLLVKNNDEDENQSQFQTYQQNSNIFIDPAQMNPAPMNNINQYGHFDDPQVYASSFNNNLINQAASIPFLYHNQ